MIKFSRATLGSVRLQIVISGGSGAGKTTSALRLATGMAQGGKVLLIDTDNGRSALSAPGFAFDSYCLGAPYSGDHYVEALTAAKELRPAVVIIDTVSEEHAQLLQDHTRVLNDMVRVAKAAAKKFGRTFDEVEYRAKNKLSAWGPAKEPRNRMLLALRDTPFHVILCVRAALKLNVSTMKKEIDTEGFDGFVKDATASFYLPPNSDGVPDFKPQNGAEWATKLHGILRGCIKPGEQLSESVGASMVQAIQGSEVSTTIAPPVVDDDAKDAIDLAIERATTLQELVAIHKEHKHAIRPEDQPAFAAKLGARKQEILNGEKENDLPEM